MKLDARFWGIVLAVLGLLRAGVMLWQDTQPETSQAAKVALQTEGYPALGRTAPLSHAIRQTLPDTSESNGFAVTSERQACRVLTVYDGDTLGCDLNANGRIDRPGEEIRLLGIDSPEMHYSRKNPTYHTEHPEDEPFARDSSHWLETRAARKTVYLEFDRRHQDKYERTLAYVYLRKTDPVSLNQQSLAAGMATVLFLGRNRLHEAEFRQAEADARQAGNGLWHTAR